MPNEAMNWVLTGESSPWARLHRAEREAGRETRRTEAQARRELRDAANQFSTLSFSDHLHQDRFWKTDRGTVVVISDMVPEHAANALRMLARRYLMIASSHVAKRLGAEEGTMTEAEEDELALAMAQPEQWFTKLPQIRALFERASLVAAQ